MTAMTASVVILLASAQALWAHEYPIKPVRVVLRVEPDRLVADIRSDSIYWIEEVTGDESMPPTGWKKDDLARAEKYANEHLRMTADDKPLNGKLAWAEYVQRPWQVNEQGEFRLRLVYPAVWDAGTLSGTADFFEDYRQERIKGGQPILPFMDFRAFLRVAGDRSARFELKPGADAFTVPVAQARRSAVKRFCESMRTGAARGLGLMEGWPALAGLALSLTARSSPALAMLALGLAWPASAAAAWAAGLIAGISAARWTGESAAVWLEAAALALLGSAWAGAASFWLPRAAPGILERLGGGIGACAAAALALIAGLLVVSLEKRRATKDSASGAAELFARRRRLAATVLVIVSACGLWQEFRG